MYSLHIISGIESKNILKLCHPSCVRCIAIKASHESYQSIIAPSLGIDAWLRMTMKSRTSKGSQEARRKCGRLGIIE